MTPYGVAWHVNLLGRIWTGWTSGELIISQSPEGAKPIREKIKHLHRTVWLARSCCTEPGPFVENVVNCTAMDHRFPSRSGDELPSSLYYSLGCVNPLFFSVSNRFLYCMTAAFVSRALGVCRGVSPLRRPVSVQVIRQKCRWLSSTSYLSLGCIDNHFFPPQRRLSLVISLKPIKVTSYRSCPSFAIPLLPHTAPISCPRPKAERISIALQKFLPARHTTTQMSRWAFQTRNM